MVRSVETLNTEIKALETATLELGKTFQTLYGEYLQALGRAVKQQAVLATYHLCTQIYPDPFLELSVADRERLQQGVKVLGQQAAAGLVALGQSTENEDENVAEPTSSADSVSSLDGTPDGPVEGPVEDPADVPADEAAAGEAMAGPETDPEGESEEEDAVAMLAQMGIEGVFDEGGAPSIEAILMAAMAHQARILSLRRRQHGGRLTPTLLAKQHLLLEQQIRQVLHRVSQGINQLLRQARVLPDLPEGVLEAAAEAEPATDKLPAAPNLLSVLVEMAEDDDDPDDPEVGDDADRDDDGPSGGLMAHLAAVHLRLSDIEFADMETAIWRGKLRSAVGKLRQLGKRYQRTQRELAIAQAEQAWRAVWYDERPRTD